MGPLETRDERRTRPCTDCGYRNVPWAAACSLCGGPLRRDAARERARVDALTAPRRPPTPWWVLGLGAFFAPALAELPILQYVGWFLGSLVHETGHCAAAWFFGAPAYPAIRIDGHAAAMHSQQRMVLVVLVMAALLWWTWSRRHRPRLRLVCGALVLVYPLLALTQAHELLHLLAGHLGELTFGAVFFYRALSGGFTESVPERITHAAVAWFLVGKNVVLGGGLMTSAAARSAYAANGSFGLTQDLVRASRQLACPLGTVGAGLLLVALLAVPVATLVWRRTETAGARAQSGG